MSKHLTQLTIHAAPFVVTIEPLELAYHLCALKFKVLAVFLQRLSTQMQIFTEKEKASNLGLATCLEKASNAVMDAERYVYGASLQVRP